MIRQFGFVIAAIALCILVYGPIVYFSRKESLECDQVVFLEGEMSLDIRDVSSFENGMSHIELCDGTTMEVPTSRIIKIVDKDVQ